LPEPDGLAVSRDGALFGRADPDDGRDTENLSEDRRQRPHAFPDFCEGCGSPLFTSGDGGPDDWGIRWGSIRQRDQLKPARQIWCRSAAPWINDIRDLPERPFD
jgi:hypothetical protein